MHTSPPPLHTKLTAGQRQNNMHITHSAHGRPPCPIFLSPNQSQTGTPSSEVHPPPTCMRSSRLVAPPHCGVSSDYYKEHCRDGCVGHTPGVQPQQKGSTLQSTHFRRHSYTKRQYPITHIHKHLPGHPGATKTHTCAHTRAHTRP